MKSLLFSAFTQLADSIFISHMPIGRVIFVVSTYISHYSWLFFPRSLSLDYCVRIKCWVHTYRYVWQQLGFVLTPYFHSNLLVLTFPKSLLVPKLVWREIMIIIIIHPSSSSSPLYILLSSLSCKLIKLIKEYCFLLIFSHFRRYVAELGLALDYLQQKHIIHR